jgi:translation initiation factor IF-1
MPAGTPEAWPSRACAAAILAPAPHHIMRPTVPRKESNVAKEELVEFGGQVAEVLPDNRFRVVLENGAQIWAYSSGRMKKHRIRILAGDRVTLEMSPYDLTKGRINYRHKN